jgi:hypothetical protein
MRARAGLAGTLLQLGNVDGALAHYRDMLKLNSNDNQGIRYVLAGCLLRQDNDSAFRRDVAWQTAKETPIEPLLEQLEFTSDKRTSGIGAISCASACSRSATPTWRGSRGPWVHRWCDSSQWPLDSASRSADAYSNVACSGG